MKTNKLIVRMVFFACLVSSISLIPAITGLNFAQAQEKKASERQTRRTPALRSKVYEQLSRAQTQADNGDTTEAFAILAEVKRKSNSMNSYELAMMYNFYGFIHYNGENYDEAIAAFERVIAQQPIPESFEQATLFSLAQLHMMRANYDKTIQMLQRWETLNVGEIPVKNAVLKAQAMYQKKDYQAAEGYISHAIRQHERAGMLPDESWLILQRAVFYELKKSEKVRDVLVKLIRLYPAAKYWIQLAGMYGELGEEQQQLATMEAAYQQGYITSAADVFNLAQLYYYHQAPYKGAKLLEMALTDGLLEKNLTNLKFLSQCWSAAQENDKAIPVMQAAADLSVDGELDAQLGQIFLTMDKWDQAIAASKTALAKGGLRNQGTTHLVLGMAYFNQQRFVEALNALADAEKHKSSRGMAQQWSKFVQTEKVSHERMRQQLTSS